MLPIDPKGLHAKLWRAAEELTGVRYLSGEQQRRT